MLGPFVITRPEKGSLIVRPSDTPRPGQLTAIWTGTLPSWPFCSENAMWPSGARRWGYGRIRAAVLWTATSVLPSRSGSGRGLLPPLPLETRVGAGHRLRHGHHRGGGYTPDGSASRARRRGGRCPIPRRGRSAGRTGSRRRDRRRPRARHGVGPHGGADARQRLLPVGHPRPRRCASVRSRSWRCPRSSTTTTPSTTMASIPTRARRVSSAERAWRRQAACRGRDTNEFFPSRGERFDDVPALCQACPRPGRMPRLRATQAHRPRQPRRRRVGRNFREGPSPRPPLRMGRPPAPRTARISFGR